MRIKELVNNLSARAAALSAANDDDYTNTNIATDDIISNALHIDGEPQSDFVYDYYIDHDITPPWFEDYKNRREGVPVNWEYVYHSLQDGRTKDETAYLIRKYEREHNGSLDGCEYTYNKTF